MRRLNSAGDLVSVDFFSLDHASGLEGRTGGLPRRQQSTSMSGAPSVSVPVKGFVRPRTVAGLCTVLLVLAYFRSDAFRASRTPSHYHFTYGTECSRLLNLGRWAHHAAERCESARAEAAVCGEHPRTWSWDAKALSCGARRSDRAAMQDLLRGKWLAMAGDSIARSLYAALLRIFDDDESSDSRRVAYGHQSFEYKLPGDIRASFFWAPYTANVTEQIRAWHDNEVMPDILVVGTALWHLLHIHDADAYEHQLRLLRDLKLAMLSGVPAFFLAPSQVAEAKLKDAQKRKWMTRRFLRRYQAALEHSDILSPNGPFRLIDMQRLTEGCGETCTNDGIHYLNATYDAALQIWSNSLRLEPVASS